MWFTVKATLGRCVVCNHIMVLLVLVSYHKLCTIQLHAGVILLFYNISISFRCAYYIIMSQVVTPKSRPLVWRASQVGIRATVYVH